MELNAVIQFEDGMAHYHIHPESNGIYQARLVRFDGHSSKTPPNEVILVRGYRQWSGSYERQDLLNEIGRAIERENTGPAQPA